MENVLNELNQFLGKATLATYAGSGPETDSQGSGFVNLEYREGPWYYRDSYTGFFQSWGQEVVWLEGKPFWTTLYGGGMAPEYQYDEAFAEQTFAFLKKALSAGEKSESFQPRGPKKFVDGDWEYLCEWEGEITLFNGSEKIMFNGKVIFTHTFFGGLIISKQETAAANSQ
jgi:hypothetical protein